MSADVLELALRLRQAGYRVYVPLLFGSLNDNPQSLGLALKRTAQLRNDPAWLATVGEVHRPIIDQIKDLCSQIMDLPENRHRRLGVIGLCFTGIVPIALLGQSDEIPGFTAMVVSQPSLPLLSCNSEKRHSLGISPAELQTAQDHVKKHGWEILGFRFGGDQVSPEERFVRLGQEFRLDGKSRFIDRTLPEREYIDREHMDPRSHSVLTSCYAAAAPGTPACALPATQIAWRRLLVYLDAKLNHPVPQTYSEPFPDRVR